MVVAYYTSTHFLDVILETIQSIKHKVELHVFIEINHYSKNATIVNVESIDGLNPIEPPVNVLGAAQWEQLKPYFEGVASVQFIVRHEKRSLSLKTIRQAHSLGKFFKGLKVDVLHFDTISTTAIGMYNYLKNTKTIIALHDPVPHSGENNWKEDIPRMLFYSKTDAFVFYSKFATQQFRQHYSQITAPLYTIQLQPYSIIRQYLKPAANAGDYILFFGRLSEYKGIDILLEAIPLVLEKFPNQKFKIAGKPVFGFEMAMDVVTKYKDNIEVISRFLSTEELVQMVQGSQFVVCPYRDATQSGVLMTTYAAGKMAIATNVGSFPEYVRPGENGLLAEANAFDFAARIIEALTGDAYKKLEAAIHPNSTPEIRQEIGKQLIDAYINVCDKTGNTLNTK